MRKPFVAGNWKMYGTKAFIKDLVTGLNAKSSLIGDVSVAVCPPAIYLDYTQSLLEGSKISLGAQNICQVAGQGAFTGETSVDMLKDCGSEYVILGHSERRSIYGETDQLVAEKVNVALKAGIKPILCVGETLEQRDAGQVESVISGQLKAVLDVVGIKSFADVVIAYEPVWAIGTGKTATSAQAQDVHSFIRRELAAQDSEIARKIIIQYGGSVKPENAKELFSQPDIDGGLIGGASLSADDFIAICQAAGA